MKVILLKDVKKVGKAGELVEVADGYGRNYLIRNNLAVLATATSKEVLSKQQAQHDKQLQKDEAAALEIKKQLETITLEFPVKAGVEGKVFGSISTKQIADKLEREYQIKVDRRKFLDSTAINTLGISNLEIELFKGVIATIKVHLVAKE